MTEYTPDEMTAREMYLAGSTLYRETPEQHYLGAPEPDYRAEFDRFLARVRRDAVRQFIEACKAKRDEPGLLLPANHWEDIDAAIRVAESYVKNYPEKED